MRAPLRVPGFFTAALVGAGLAFAGTSAQVLLAPVLGAYPALKLITIALALAYGLWLLARSPLRVGRIVTAVAVLMAAAALWFLAPTLFLLIAALTVLISGLRCLYFRSSLLMALLDGGLSLLALGAAIWASSTGSLFLSLWTFFLVQAATAWIPEGPGTASKGAEPGRSSRSEDAFDQAHRQAEAALRRLASH